MSDEVEYSCTKCRRPIRAPRAQVLQLLARNRKRCLLCGSPLEFPADVLAEFDGAHKVGARDVRDAVSYTCGGCRRTYSRPLKDVVIAIVRGKTTCPVCARPYVFPPEVDQAVAELKAQGSIVRDVSVECPTCDRPARGDLRTPDVVLKCGVCGAQFRASEGGWLPPPVAEPVSVGEVKSAIARIPSGEHGTVVADALLARAARAEVTKGEAETLARVMRGLSAWEPEADDPVPFLPLDVDEAQTVVPWLLMPGLSCFRERTPDGWDLVFTVGRQTELTAKGALNLLSAVSVLAGGAGLFKIGGSEDSTRDAIQRLRVSLIETEHGSQLGLARQVDDGRPTRASTKELVALSATLAAGAPAIRSYYALVALFGPWARGMPAFVASEAAILKRLLALGEPLASRAATLAPRLKVWVEKR
jgi:hypothetical protein